MSARNMYGCTPCPECGSEYRYGVHGADEVCCDDCGYVEQGAPVWDDDDTEET